MANENWTHWRNCTSLEFLRAECLLPGQELVLTIKEIKAEEITSREGTDKKPVAYFVENDVLPMVLNVVNCETIEKIYGTGNIYDWVGKKIQVFATTTKVAGEAVPCLRIRGTVPTSSTPEYKCAFCGKKMDEATYKKTVAAYGKPYCSKECYEKSKSGNLI